MRLLFSIILLLSAHLLSEEPLEFSLVNNSKNPISKVAGSVNVITGNWLDQVQHHTPSGPDSFPLAHSYVSSSLEEGSLADGWDFFLLGDLEVFQPKGVRYVPKGIPLEKGAVEKSKPSAYQNDATLFYRDSTGSTVVFKGDENARHFKPKLGKTGYMHTNSIDNPSRRNIHRTKIHWNSHSDEWIVTLGDDTKLTYSRADTHKHRPRPNQKAYFKRQYHITEEKLPSGNKRFYSYDDNKDLKRIVTKSSDGKKILHVFLFKWKKDSVRVVSSDRTSTTFALKNLKDRDNARVVTKIIRPGKAKLAYDYSETSSRHPKRVKNKRTGARDETAKFYHPGKVSVGARKVTVKKKNLEFFDNRVRELWTRSLKGEHVRLSHAFTYKECSHNCWTGVKEPDGYRSFYSWDKEDKFPGRFQKKSPDGKLLSEEKYTWHKGRLIRKDFFSESKRLLLSKKYEFDKEGNVTKEVLKGSFSGFPCNRLKIKKEKPEGGERREISAKYDDRSRKISEVDPEGNHTYFQYSGSLLTGRIYCFGKKPIQREFFTYDSCGVCIEEISDDGSTHKKGDLSGVTRRSIRKIKPRYAKPFFGAPKEESWHVWTPSGGEQFVKKERHIKDSFGRTVTKELVDSSGTVRKKWHFEYDSLHRPIRLVDPVGAFEEFSYTESGQLAGKKTPLCRTSYRYDLFDRLIEEKKSFPDGSTSTISHSYSITGRETTTIDERGRKTITKKDSLGRVVSLSSPALCTEQGVVSPLTTASYKGLTETHTSPTGAVSTATLSSSGKKLSSTSPAGETTLYFYDKLDRLIEQREPSGITVSYVYDARGRVVQETKSDGITSYIISRRYAGYDLVEEIHPAKVITYSYDHFGNKITEQIRDLSTNAIETIHTKYDSLHRAVAVVHADYEELTAYDDADRVIETKKIGIDGSLLSIATKSYDLAGRVVEEGVGCNGTLSRTATTYGAYGLPSKTLFPDGTSVHVAYAPLTKGPGDLFYLKKSTTDARGVVTEELLDANDTPISTIVKDPYGHTIAHKKAEVNLLGKPTLIEEQAISNDQVASTVLTRLSYDNLGQLLSCTLADKTPESATWSYCYDAFGRKVEEKKPSGVSLFSEYDPWGRLSHFYSSDSTIDWKYAYNIQGLPTSVISKEGATTRTYNGLGQMTSEILANELSLSYEWEANGQLKQITYPDGSSSLYTYRSGQLSSIRKNEYCFTVLSRDLSGLITSASLPGKCGEITFSVDAMGRRTSVVHAGFSEVRTAFDPVGNCTARTINKKKENFSYDYLSQLTNDNGRASSYDSLNRRTSHKGLAATHNHRHQLLSFGKESFSYDADGRRLHDAKFTYEYDACDRLTAVEGGSTRREYAYDPFNRRLFTKVFSGGTLISMEAYLWQGDDEIGNTGLTPSLRVLGEGLGAEIGAAVFYEIDGKPYIPLHDLSGHVRASLNPDGKVMETLSYTATALESRSAEISPWTFSSKRQDDTDFIYFGRRYYDPHTATWLTQDPLGQSAGPNLYAYTRNNPLTSVDLYGLFDIVGGAISCWNSICDVCSSAWNGICDFFSGGGGSSSSSLGGSGPGGGSGGEISLAGAEVSQEVSEKTETPREERATRSVTTKNGNPVVWLRNLLFTYPEGDPSKFFEKYRGSNLERRVGVYINGMRTSLQTAWKTAKEIAESGKLLAVIVLYNATHGGASDLVEAVLSLAGMFPTVEKELLHEIRGFFNGCVENGVSFTATVFAHSHGTLIAHNIFSGQEFAKGSTCGRFIRNHIYMGGPKAFPGKNIVNYAARGDLVTHVLPSNHLLLSRASAGVATPGYNIRFVGGGASVGSMFRFETHDVLGSAYKEAMTDYFSRGN